MVMNWIAFRISAALKGILHAAINDASYQLNLLGGAAVIAVFTYFAWPLSEFEALFIGFAYALVLITELQNSSLEEALNHLHPGDSHSIGRSKDMAAGAVLIAGSFFIAVLTVIALTRLL